MEEAGTKFSAQNYFHHQAEKIFILIPLLLHVPLILTSADLPPSLCTTGKALHWGTTLIEGVSII